jgi:hypothetical protein
MPIVRHKLKPGAPLSTKVNAISKRLTRSASGRSTPPTFLNELMKCSSKPNAVSSIAPKDLRNPDAGCGHHTKVSASFPLAH